MILPCTSPPDIIYANMKSVGSGRGITASGTNVISPPLSTLLHICFI